jgi:uncharacterized protein YjbJ (UPF0337 family)
LPKILLKEKKGDRAIFKEIVIMIQNLVTKQRLFLKKIALIFCLSLTVTIIWSTNTNSMSSAHAVTIAKNPLVIALGEGTGDKVQGKLEETIGAAKQNLGKATGQTEGAAQQAKGKAQQNLGEAKSRIDKAGNDLEKSSDNFVDAIKHFFGQ